MASEAQSSVCCSAKEGALKTNSEAINNARSSFLSDTVNRFVSERLREKKRQYLLTLKLGVFFFAICIAIDLIRVAFTDQLIRTKWVFIFSVSAFYSAGMLTISVCPLDELDLDESLNSLPGFRTIIFVLLAGQFIGYGWVSYPHAPAYVFFLQSLPCLWIVFGGRRVHVGHNPRATTLFSCSNILGCFAYGLKPLVGREWWRGELCEDVVCMLKGAVSMSFAALLNGRLLYVKYWCKGSMAQRYPTLSCYEILYGITTESAFLKVIESVADIYFSRTSSGVWRLATGLVLLASPLMVAVYGREAIFGFMSRRFDRTNSARDGAFLAELFIKDVEYFVGDQFWLHERLFHIEEIEVIKQHKKTLSSCPQLKSHPGWFEAVIVALLDERIMQVKLLDSPQSIIQVSISSMETRTIDEVIANHEPRCVEWMSITSDFMTNTGRTDFYALSRPLGKHERIDIFVSHSSRDDPYLRWTALEKTVEQFLLNKGRHPTLWIDRFCLRLHDGDPSGALQALSVQIMACDRMLILFGKTYLTSLWCAWELFVIFAFQQEQNAMDQVMLVPLLRDTCDTYIAAKQFSVAAATCYSPHDEIRLLKIIDAVGRNVFNKKVRNVIELLKPQLLIDDISNSWIEVEIQDSSPCNIRTS